MFNKDVSFAFWQDFMALGWFSFFVYSFMGMCGGVQNHRLLSNTFWLFSCLNSTSFQLEIIQQKFQLELFFGIFPFFSFSVFRIRIPNVQQNWKETYFGSILSMLPVGLWERGHQFHGFSTGGRLDSQMSSVCVLLLLVSSLDRSALEHLLLTEDSLSIFNCTWKSRILGREQTTAHAEGGSI